MPVYRMVTGFMMFVVLFCALPAMAGGGLEVSVAFVERSFAEAELRKVSAQTFERMPARLGWRDDAVVTPLLSARGEETATCQVRLGALSGDAAVLFLALPWKEVSALAGYPLDSYEAVAMVTYAVSGGDVAVTKRFPRTGAFRFASPGERGRRMAYRFVSGGPELEGVEVRLSLTLNGRDEGAPEHRSLVCHLGEALKHPLVDEEEVRETAAPAPAPPKEVKAVKKPDAPSPTPARKPGVPVKPVTPPPAVKPSGDLLDETEVEVVEGPTKPSTQEQAKPRPVVTVVEDGQ